MVAVAAAGVVDARVAEVRASVSLREQLLAKWREEVRGKTPAEREAWLQGPEARVALGAKKCRELVRQIRGTRASLRDVACSSEWLVAASEHGAQFPPGGDDTAMVLSRAKTRYGAPYAGAPDAVPGMTQPRRRWTPPNAVDVEDMLDAMDPREALFHHHPVSPSALAIFVQVTYGKQARARVVRRSGRSGVRRERAGAKRRAEAAAGGEDKGSGGASR